MAIPTSSMLTRLRAGALALSSRASNSGMPEVCARRQPDDHITMQNVNGLPAMGFTAYEPAITGKWLALLKEMPTQAGQGGAARHGWGGCSPLSIAGSSAGLDGTA